MPYFVTTTFKKEYVPSVIESRKIFGKIQNFNNSDSDEEIKVHDDFFDDLP